MISYYRHRVRDHGTWPLRSVLQYSRGTPPNVTNTYWPQYYISRGKDACDDVTHPGPPYRSGGPLCVIHDGGSSFTFGSYDAKVGGNANPTYYHYWGVAVPPNIDSYLKGFKPSDDLAAWGDGSSYGATGWNKAKPGKPGASFAQFIGELRDLPRMFRLRVREFKDLGSQYLNYQFGWRPFLNDLCKFLDTTQKMQARYAFLRRNNGRPMRRRCTVKWDAETTTVNTTSRPIVATTSHSVVSPQTSALPTVTVSDFDYVWFEGVFRFYIPDLGYKPTSRLAAQMYGAYPSPSVVWELVPWSWLADWFANVGDVMSNLSPSEAADGLAASYAYVMRHRSRTVTYSGDTQYYSKVNWDTGAKTMSSASATWKVVWETKTRTAASPYGFGLTWDGFSLRQLAILAALGISRS